MKRNKVIYRAYVSNDESNACEYGGASTNLNLLKTDIRARYGAGWIVTIVKIENDHGIMDFLPVEIASFTLRK